MNKKSLQRLFLIVCIAVIVIGVIWSVWLYQRERDPRLQAAREIYTVHKAIKELDENWELESLSEVYPYEIKSPDGPSIYYYCCVTIYPDESPNVNDGLNKVSISQVVDVDALENTVVCDINGYQGVLGEQGDQKYLCWTISPVYSCVVKYTKGSISESEILRIAESVNVPEK